MRRIPLRPLVLVLVTLGLAACGSPTIPDDGGCPGAPPVCHNGPCGGSCDPAAVEPVCYLGIWACPRGSVPSEQCLCTLGEGATCPGNPSFDFTQCGGDSDAGTSNTDVVIPNIE